MITVIVAIYNIKEKYLRQCIESLINQTNKNFELILIDDGSTDNSGKIIDSYKNISNIKIIHKKDEGVSVVRNLGIEVSTGDWICFVDGDDYCERNMIENMYKYLDNKIDILIFSCFINYKTKEIKNSFLPFKYKNNVCKEDLILQMISKNYSKYYPIDTAVSVPWAKLYRKDYLIKKNIKFVKGMNRMQDVIFNLYAFENSSNITYIDIPVYHYLKNDNSVVNKYSKKTMSYYKKMIEETKKFLKIYNKNEIYYKALNLFEILAIENYLTQYYFNKQNKSNYKIRKKEIINIINQCDFGQINYKILNKYQKIYIYLLKNKKIYSLKILLKIKYFIKKYIKRNKIYN